MHFFHDCGRGLVISSAGTGAQKQVTKKLLFLEVPLK
jgi:hypothetical protein